jgi:hypothetical protein
VSSREERIGEKQELRKNLGRFHLERAMSSIPDRGIRWSQNATTVMKERIPMRYVDFRDAIEKALRRHPDGLTYKQLKTRCRLPYDSPCQVWVHQLERDIGLVREKGEGRAFIWKVPIE